MMGHREPLISNLCLCVCCRFLSKRSFSTNLPLPLVGEGTLRENIHLSGTVDTACMGVISKGGHDGEEHHGEQEEHSTRCAHA